MAEFLRGFQQAAGGAVMQLAQRHVEKQRKHQDLRDLVVGHGLDDALGEDVGHELLQVQCVRFQVGGRREACQDAAQEGASKALNLSRKKLRRLGIVWFLRLMDRLCIRKSGWCQPTKSLVADVPDRRGPALAAAEGRAHAYAFYFL
ncbi:hypothetical protein ABC383_27740 [Noviherbaspirillum sp. 1P10PC]|uniref:hypothetical protein n=1 Tax=Noviherbaspirillum sp. 1P10PC TaxID=3132292 RepID=UPI0039A118AE